MARNLHISTNPINEQTGRNPMLGILFEKPHNLVL